MLQMELCVVAKPKYAIFRQTIKLVIGLLQAVLDLSLTGTLL